ncbi:MAG: PHP domain-containing protein [Sumerlaeia bacterium]
MPIIADMHSHSTASDGVDSPARVVERAAERGLKVLALSDHDTIDGVAEARAAGERLGVTVVPAVELTCYLGKAEIHMLGFGIDIDSAELAEHCEKFVAAREERARIIGQRLAELGVPIDMDEVVAKCDGGVVGRPHIGKALLDAGHVSTLQEAFDKYLANGQPACVPKLMVEPKLAIDLIHAAGGIAVMAHPGLGDQFHLIPQLAQMGLDGVEVHHSKHGKDEEAKAQSAVDLHGLVKTGGSDCHGKLGEREELLGRWGLDEGEWKAVAKRLESTAAFVG